MILKLKKEIEKRTKKIEPNFKFTITFVEKNLT